MLKGILPDRLVGLIKNYDYELINEIRLRLNAPIIATGDNKTYYLTASGLSLSPNNAITCTTNLINEIIMLVSNNSLYAVNDQLIEGYLIKNGIRIGVAGEIVVTNDKIKTIKNISSLNIRIPHLIKNCSLPIYNLLCAVNIKNILIISPPGAGKTTFLRDLIYQISVHNSRENVLIVDERSEITTAFNNVNCNFDVYKNCTKKYGFQNGIRSMKPSVIVTDEINLNDDVECLENAITSGVKVIATMHATSIVDIKNKKGFKNIIDKQLFDRYVVLGFSNGVGTIEGVFNENFRCIYV